MALRSLSSLGLLIAVPFLLGAASCPGESDGHFLYALDTEKLELLKDEGKRQKLVEFDRCKPQRDAEGEAIYPCALVPFEPTVEHYWELYQRCGP